MNQLHILVIAFTAVVAVEMNDNSANHDVGPEVSLLEDRTGNIYIINIRNIDIYSACV